MAAGVERAMARLGHDLKDPAVRAVVAEEMASQADRRKTIEGSRRDPPADGGPSRTTWPVRGAVALRKSKIRPSTAAPETVVRPAGINRARVGINRTVASATVRLT